MRLEIAIIAQAPVISLMRRIEDERSKFEAGKLATPRAGCDLGAARVGVPCIWEDGCAFSEVYCLTAPGNRISLAA